jgi:hypothetical protein
MSATGKSTALRALRARGFTVVDTDDPRWTEWSDLDDGYVWREDRMRTLILRDLAEVEPRLRAACTHELDATQPADAVAARLAGIGRAPRAGHSKGA